MSVSVASGATVNLLVDFDRAEIVNMKLDEERFERTVFSFEFTILKTLANKFSGHRCVYGSCYSSGWTIGNYRTYGAVHEGA